MPRLPLIPLPKGDRWMDIREVAALFGVTRQTIHRWSDEGEITAYKPTKKMTYYRKIDLNKLLTSRNLPNI
ncbi:helix-turn-helix domain-containing protein [Gemmata sp. G18]|uniref:Helix-turn-helix domain-containing protein n=1 Tax=Gemmata palustris TaxID=2822762 RepID=A0ABS5BMP4_9BACT|nr:helix-turn-helix domain-containing protein [Gemmata palustris]MBP3954953.1 helix-turn-helix domain-containing protein [Gemmata palustris]